MNQNPEQIARDRIDQRLARAGWTVQNKRAIDLNASLGVAVREYQTAIGPADYVLFVDKKPVGIIEAKREEEGVQLTVHERQSYGYAVSKLKYLNNDPLPFTYESTGAVTRFTDHRDPKPRSRPVFTFHRPETLRAWLKQGSSLRQRLLTLPELNTQGLRACQVQAIANLEKSL
ncbi:MAG: type I restriction endonuclease, partial [Microcystaceae cyanobacterium]